MATSERGCFSAKRKRDAVLRLLRGEDLDLLAPELGVNAPTSSGRDARSRLTTLRSKSSPPSGPTGTS